MTFFYLTIFGSYICLTFQIKNMVNSADQPPPHQPLPHFSMFSCASEGGPKYMPSVPFLLMFCRGIGLTKCMHQSNICRCCLTLLANTAMETLVFQQQTVFQCPVICSVRVEKRLELWCDVFLLHLPHCGPEIVK